MADGPARRDWRAGAAVPVQGAASKSSSVFVAGLTAVALLGALVGFLYWLLAGGEASVRYINIPLCEFVNPVWPPVPFAEADADRLVKHFAGGEKAFNDQEEERFRRKLESLKSLGDRPLVLHIAGLAVARDNQVYLLSSKAGPGVPDNNWHSLDDVFKAVAACPSKNKLLILDIAQPLADPARGVLADNASAQVTNMLRAMANREQIARPGVGHRRSRRVFARLRRAACHGFRLLHGSGPARPCGWVWRRRSRFLGERCARWPPMSATMWHGGRITLAA